MVLRALVFSAIGVVGVLVAVVVTIAPQATVFDLAIAAGVLVATAIPVVAGPALLASLTEMIPQVALAL